MTRRSAPGNVPDENTAAYYRRRAAGGTGLVVTQGAGIDQPSALGDGFGGEDHIPTLHGRHALAGWRNVVAEVHDAGGLTFPQLWHQGVFRIPGTNPVPEARSLRPSGLWGPAQRFSPLSDDYVDRVIEPTTPMTESEITDTIAGFARSAANARDVGFDGIAVHGGHGYLIDSFFWHETNQRADRYGGSLRERARFGLEVVEAIRAAVGPDMPILFRFGQWKQQDFKARLARDADELEALLGPLADAGVDVFDASTLYYSVPAFAGSPLCLAAWAKRITGKPAIAGGGIGMSSDFFTASETAGANVEKNVADAAARIDRGEFDMIHVGRSLIADPAWPQKVATNQPTTPFERSMLATLD